MSNTDPNFLLHRDRITAINSLTAPELTMSRPTAVAPFALPPQKAVHLYRKTERGLNFSIRAVPRAGPGRTIQLVSELAGSRKQFRE
ncbi:hypothetical protein ACHWWK_27500 [Klebsiella pneumoniae]